MLLICYGTRPEWIKVKPLVDERSESCRVLQIGQHTDLIDHSKVNNEFLEIDDFGNRLDSIFCSIMSNKEIFSGISKVLVQGDTASAAAVALCAFNRKIPVIHLEAGLRTYDKKHPFPEETYRQIISRIADIHLCPTLDNKNNLLNERVSGVIRVVGNTVLDNLRKEHVEYGQEVLITMHRRENHEILNQWFCEISKLAEDNKNLNFTVLSHPNPRVVENLKHLKSVVKVSEPISYDKMKERLSKCRLVISDSGGLQEEASFLKKKIIVCREKTERKESLGITSFLCPSPSMLKSVFEKIKKDFIPNDVAECPYGDGNAAYRIWRILDEI